MQNGRTTGVVLYFADGSSRTIQAIWRQQDLNDFESVVQAKPPPNPQMSTTADATFEVDLNTQQTSIGELQSVCWCNRTSDMNTADYGQAANFQILQIQPKGMGYPPSRVYVQLRRC